MIRDFIRLSLVFIVLVSITKIILVVGDMMTVPQLIITFCGVIIIGLKIYERRVNNG